VKIDEGKKIYTKTMTGAMDRWRWRTLLRKAWYTHHIYGIENY